MKKFTRSSASVILRSALALLALAALVAFAPNAQAKAYVSVATGNWNAAATWSGDSGTPTTTDTAEIANGTTVTVSSGVTCAGVLIDHGGDLITSSKVTINHGANTYDLDVHGTIDVTTGSGVTFGTGSTTAIIETDGTFLGDDATANITGGTPTSFIVNGTYNIKVNETQMVFPAGTTWGPASLLEFTGITSDTTSPVLPSSLANLTWNCPSQTGTVSALFGATAGTYTVSNFTVTSTGTGILELQNYSTPGTLTLNVNGSFNIGSAATVAASSKNNTTAVNAINFTGSGTITVSGTWLTGSTSTSEGEQCNWTVNSGSVMTLGANWTLAGQYNEGSTHADTLTVASGGTLNCSTFSVLNNTLSGAGGNETNTFTLASGGTLSTGSTAGITSSGATGSIQVNGTRSFSTNANYTYNGISAQVAGNGLPTVVNNLSLSNIAGVTLSGNVAPAGAFSVVYASGTPALAAGGNTFTLDNNAVTITVTGSPIADDVNYTIVSTNGGSVTGSTGGSLTVNGSGAPAGTTSISDNTGQLVLTVAGETATGLQVVLPGQTGGTGAVNGSPTGQTAGVPFNVTVYAVDASGYLVANATPTINFTSSDGAATLPGSTSLVNGTATVSVTFKTGGSQTVTATNSSLGSYTSSLVTVLQLPIVETAPTASSIYVGQDLNDSTLSGGACTNASGAAVPGTFAFTTPLATPGVGTSNQSVTFTPSNAVQYSSISFNVSVTVLPLQTPILETAPTASTITYGQTLSNSVLSGGACTNASGAAVPGTFAFTTPAAIPGAGTSNQSVTFTPGNPGQYSNLIFNVSVTVDQVTFILSNAPTASVIYISQALSNSVLSGGACTNSAGAVVPGIFAFTTPAATPGLGTSNQSVTFTPTDVTDYSSISFNVSVTVTPFTNTILTTNSSSPWTVPPGVTAITVQIWGGGGAGGGAPNTDVASGGGGGGGGAYATTNLSGLTPGNTIAFLVGTGGTGSANGNGTSGNPTSFGNGGSPITAAGGGGGGAAASPTGGTGGTGGSYSGGTGAAGTSTYGGGGGSGEGTNVSGNNGSGSTGGLTVEGGGAGANGNIGSGSNGAPGIVPGGGGGGAFEHGTTSRAGGAGGPGEVIITLIAVPTVNCPANINDTNATGQCGNTESFAATTNNTGVPTTLTYTIPGPTTITSPYFFPVGTTTVTSTVTNAAGTNSCTFTVTVNDTTPPVPGPFSLGAVDTMTTSVPIAKILALASETSPPGGALSISSPTASNGTAAVIGGMLTYLPTGNYTGPDTINYTLSDGCGTALGAISVTVSANGPGSNGLTITGSPGSATLQFFGIPNTPYYIQMSSPNPNGPWTDLNGGNPVTSDSNGMINFTVNSPPSPSYYRTSANP